MFSEDAVLLLLFESYPTASSIINSTIGKLGFWRIVVKHHSAELGYTMLPPYDGNGYMFEGVQAVLKYGFEKMELHSVEANLDPNNRKFEALLIKNGFIKEGHNKENCFFKGTFLDTASYSLLRRNWENK